MAFDPIQTLTTYARTDCSVQMWVADAPAMQFRSLRDAVAYAREQGAKWKDVEITVHLAREDIAYGTDKTRMLIDALTRLSKQAPTNEDSEGEDDGQALE